jgi:uncharacterized protein
VSVRERFESLDYLRGVAILGMLIANVPWHVGSSMSRVRDADLGSASAWLAQYLIVDQRFMPIFCMLFGAGFLILAAGRENEPGFAGYIWRRMGILFGIGLAHAYLLWPGDILLTYAICGPILLLFYRLNAGWLLALGIAFKALDLILLQWPAVHDATFHRWLFSWWLEIGDPPMSEAAAYAGSYADLFSYNAWRNQFIQWTAMPYFRMWNALGFMLIGMAMYRWGVLQAAVSQTVLRKMMWLALLIGLPILVYGIVGLIGNHDTLGPYLGWETSLTLTTLTHMGGSAVTAIVLLAFLLLIYQANPRARWLTPIKAVGRMALTNYVMHSVIFLVVFAGFEWVAYDSLEPDDRLVWVVGIWALQLVASPVWLKAFGQGPLEMMWRKLAGRGPDRQVIATPSPSTIEAQAIGK